jgi:sodium transport system ATP-binding protein
MEEYMDRRAGKFSKGMKQKVAIARSIVHNPPIMLFDEPTSGLDVTAIRVVQEFIKELKNEGKTIIFSSHSMAEVEKLCDRVGVINKGKLVAIGTLEELKREHGTDDLEEVFIRLIGGEKHD